jgi:hypothetical protein
MVAGTRVGGGGGGDGGGATALHCWWRGDGEGRRKKRKILLRLGWAGPAIILLFCPNFLWAKYKIMHQIVLRAGAKVRGTAANNVGSRDGVNQGTTLFRSVNQLFSRQ